MNRQEVEAVAMALPAATKVVQWGDSDVFKVGGKVFAISGDDGVSFKVTDIGFEVLTSGGPGHEAVGRQAPYCAKGQWVNVAHSRLEAEDCQGWLATAHSLIAGKLTKKARAELGL